MNGQGAGAGAGIQKNCGFSVISALLISVWAGTLFAKHAVDPTASYHRLICLIHLTGKGTSADPIRPEYVPTDPPDRSGIIAWAFQITDDKHMAIVQMVAVNRNAFQAVLSDKRPEIRVFEIGKDRPEVIEAAMKAFKKDFTLDSLRVVAR